MAVAIEDINHLKTFPAETRTSVFKQKTKPPIPNGNLKQTLPIATGLSVGRISDEKVLRTLGAIFIRAKVVGNFIMEVQITFHIFDLRKLERLHRADRGLGEWSKRSGGRRRT
jgi:hypothetical protein